VMSLEYGASFSLPVRINRCGVLAGAGQFGRADQGIFSYWIHSWKRGHPLRYIGFDGKGHQVRDCLHPSDLAEMILLQIKAGMDPEKPSIQNLSGGVERSYSLRQLSNWCADRFGPVAVESEGSDRPNDLPWMVLDSQRAKRAWNWEPKVDAEEIFEEIARHAEEHPDWLDLSSPS